MKHLLTLLLIAFVTVAAVAQENNLFWTMRVKVKLDKKAEWEKKAPAFMKTHYPQYNFRVYEIMAGDNTGSYFIAIGPLTYKDLDAPPVFPKGEALLKSDRAALDALCESLEVQHYRRDEEISDMKKDRKLKYLLVTMIEMDLGKWSDAKSFVTRLRKARAESGAKVDYDYYRPLNTGTVNRYVSVRYFQTMQELDMETGVEEAYDKLFGNNAWFKDFGTYVSLLRSVNRELRVLREDLSTPNAATVASTN